jgi:hydroxyjasmonate sulfotransferase
VEQIIKWCSFESMKNNDSVNYEWYKVFGLFNKDGNFFRKGKIGDWLNHFDCETSKKFDLHVKETIKDGHKFDYGISPEDLAKVYDLDEIK